MYVMYEYVRYVRKRLEGLYFSATPDDVRGALVNFWGDGRGERSIEEKEEFRKKKKARRDEKRRDEGVGRGGWGGKRRWLLSEEGD